jgi:nicotinamide riboside transporter PnuC
MQDLVNALGKDLSLVLIFLVVGATVVAIIGLFQWRKIEQRRMEASLKQEMLQRGLTISCA